LGAGVLGGFATMLANAAGPVIQLYLMTRNVPKMELIGIGARFFLLINILKVPLNAKLALITQESLLENLKLVPAVAVGIFGGKWLLRHVPQAAFEWMIVTFATLAGLRMIFW
ncbi:MAG: sulfite exporter TauE/SafE family protein, partial [Verrucomicrobiaceae bacterium]